MQIASCSTPSRGQDISHNNKAGNARLETPGHRGHATANTGGGMKPRLDETAYRAGYVVGYQQALLGEQKSPPPQQSEDWLRGWDQGYSDGEHRPKRRVK